VPFVRGLNCVRVVDFHNRTPPPVTLLTQEIHDGRDISDARGRAAPQEAGRVAKSRAVFLRQWLRATAGFFLTWGVRHSKTDNTW
jgi:hypothetical protein